jgi:integrase
MSVTETAQGTWRARIRDARGRQVTKTFRLKADAKTWERNQLQARDDGQLVTGGRTTIRKWADVWLAGARNLSPRTVELYREDLDRYILPALGDVPLARLSAEDIDAYLAEQSAKLAPSSVHRHYRTIHRLCEVAVKRGRLAVNPCQAVEPPKVPKTEKRFLSVAEVEALAAAINPRYRAWVLVAAWGGLRWGELRALQPANFDGTALTVIKQLGNADLKTKGSRRRVVLAPSVAAELTDHIATYPGTLIFTSSNGKPLVNSTFASKHFKPALEATGLDRGVRIHDLRHTAVALAISAGAHPKMIADMVGHDSISTTMDEYGHLFASMHDEVASRLDELRRHVGEA